MKKWMCSNCGWIYDGSWAIGQWHRARHALGGLPESWVCPDCNAEKAQFEMVEI